MKLPIYMDYHATTPIDPRVLEAMHPFLAEKFGNAASRNHAFGWEAEKAVESCRKTIAKSMGADPEEIIFTSGATEANNIALKGVFEIYQSKRNHLITQVTEHKSVLDTCKYLEGKGAKVTYLPVDNTGLMSLQDLEKALSPQSILISVMFANNEVGTIQPIAEIGKLAKKHNVLFHVDAAQAAGRVPIDVEKMGIDLLSFSSHKMYGPKGVGVLYVRKKNPRVRLAPLIHGGGHERGLRSGTLHVAGIVGLAKACEITSAEMPSEMKRITTLRDRLQKGFEERLDQIHINGHPTQRLGNNLNVSFTYVEGESLLMSLGDEIAISSGSACATAKVEPSHVLKALKLSGQRVHSAVRFGLGRFTTDEDIDYVLDRVVTIVKRLRGMSPLYSEDAEAKAVDSTTHSGDAGQVASSF